ncbi:MAG: AAA family ATPase [Holophagales bacterium]|nr:AAA family ATPase [Holophagales bacterium]MYH24845.1 AAA family ATPase [Holophagales bacterium]
MKLTRAHFENFRLLRDLTLDFGCDESHPLTVIRAANESGKTTVLHALQWALYGDAALPGRGQEFRLHPIDWDTDDGSRVTITATVDFELTTHRRIGGRYRETRRRYRLVRTAVEDATRQFRRGPSSVKLFHLTEAGASPIEAPDSLIREELPPELREVFFTDGDRALSFIEADVTLSTKRDRVERAIRSLLGLGLIDDALRHVAKTKAEMNKKARGLDGSGRLSVVASRLDLAAQEEDRLRERLEDAKEQFRNVEDLVASTDRKIAAALQKGDREKLSRERASVKDDMASLDKQLAAAAREHSQLLTRSSLAFDLVSPTLSTAMDSLDDLREEGKIPNTTVPVLEDRLETNLCICGEDLDAADPQGRRRRSHIESLIRESRRADAIQELITDLYYGAKQLFPKGTERLASWRANYAQVARRRDDLEGLREKAGRQYRSLEDQIKLIPDTNLQGLRQSLAQYRGQRDRLLSTQATTETQLDGLRKERDSLERERDQLLRSKEKGARVLAGLDVAKDVETVLKGAYDRITDEELTKVSGLMNDIFLEMIGADPEQGAIIRRAEISKQFDIVVYGPQSRMLNPDRDLNGASRRALTLAFILALTRVSEVVAPNVIDTPLGMTSGFVKRSILRTAVRESTQLILFLTHDEIAGCEDILDETAGVVFTLTNPAHYPRMLINDPGVEERKVLRCECDHRTSCALCERRLDLFEESDQRTKETANA